MRSSLFILLFLIGFSCSTLVKRIGIIPPQPDDLVPYRWKFTVYSKTNKLFERHHLILAEPLDLLGNPIPTEATGHVLLPDGKNVKMMTGGVRRVELILDSSDTKKLIITQIVADRADINLSRYKVFGEPYITTEAVTGEKVTNIIRNRNKDRYADGAKYKYFTNNCQTFAKALMGDVKKFL